MVRFERWSKEEKQYVLVHKSTIPPANSVTCKKIKLIEAKRCCHNLTKMEKTKKSHTNTNHKRGASTKH